MSDEIKVIAGVACGCVCLGLILMAILIPCSYSIIEIEEYGILYNNNDKSLQKESHNSTRDFVGLGKKYKTFPSGFVDIDYTTTVAYTPNLACWSSNGVNIYISLGFYLQLNRTAIYDIFGGNDNDQWQKPLIRSAMTAIKETTVKFDTLSFFTGREAIKKQIWSNIQKKVDNDLGPIMQIKVLYFTSIKLDDDFEDAITDKLIQLQQLRTYQIKQQAAEILKENEIMQVYADNNITIIESEAEAKGAIIKNSINADIFCSKIENEALVYKDLKSSLALTNEQLLKFIYVNELAQISPSAIILNPKNTFIQLNNKLSTTTSISNSSTNTSTSNSSSSDSKTKTATQSSSSESYSNNMKIVFLLNIIFILFFLFSF